MGATVQKRGESRREAFYGVLVMTTALAVGGSAVSAYAQSQGPVQVQPQQRNFDIPAQPLAGALTLFGRQSGMQISVDAGLVRGVSSPGVNGAMAPRQALERLLAGTGITYRLTSDNTAMLEKAPQASSTGANVIQLGPVRVEGQEGAGTAGLQDPNGPGDGYIATRSTTGTKSDTPIIETPQSISVVTRQQMDDQQPQTINEALRYTVGVIPETTGTVAFNSEAGSILLRGFQPQSFLDGLETLSTTGGVGADPYLLNRVEVLGGPSSVLYGSATPGGLVNAESKLPTTSALHELQLQGGSYGRYEGAFDFSGPIDGDERFLYRLTGIGFSENNQAAFTKAQEIAVAPALTWRIDPETSLTVLGKYIDNPATGAQSYIPTYGSALPNPNGKIPTSFFPGDPNANTATQEQESIGYIFEHRFNDSWKFQQDFRYEHSSGDALLIYPTSLEADFATLDRYLFKNDQSLSLTALDSRLSGKFDLGPVINTVTVGLDYQRTTFNFSGGFSFDVPSINLFHPVYYQAIPTIAPANFSSSASHIDQLGFYAQDQISVDRWRFLLGARGDWADSQGSSSSGSTSGYFERVPTWRVGIVYLFDNGLAPYASYSTSFQPQTGNTFSGATYLPLTGQQYELGLKYQPAGWSSFVTAAIYDLREQNVLAPDPAHLGFSVQTGEVASRGIELQGHADLTKDLSLIATYTYSDVKNAKDVGVTDTTIGGVTEPVQGKVPVGIPSQMASVWANYTIPSGVARSLGFSAGVRYLGESWGDDVNSFRVPATTLVDAALHYELGTIDPALKGVKLQVNATNLFDKTYVASCAGSTACWYGTRRTVYATLKYDW